MAITITDNRTLVDHADATTGWSSPTASEALTVFTSDPAPVELTGCIGMVVSTETSDIVHTITAANLTGTLVYVWVLANGNMDTLVNGGIAIVLGDGTDEIGYHVAGSDIAVFRHSEGPVGWQCLVIDTANLPTDFTVLAGVEANLNIAAITQIGAMFKTLSAALGGVSNCFIDTIRYGSTGIIAIGGTAGTPATFVEIAEEDRSPTSGKASGIFRKLGLGSYGVQGSLTIGDGTGVLDTYFYDQDVVVSFEDRNLNPGRFGLLFKGNATGTSDMQFGLPVSGTTGGTNGVSFIAPPGTGPFMSSNSPNLQDFRLYGCTIAGFTGWVVLSLHTSAHEVFNCLFTGNAQIFVFTTQFKNNRIVDAIPKNALEGSLLFPASDADIEDLQFTMGATGHGIHFSGSGTFELRDMTFTGYSLNMEGTQFNTETEIKSSSDFFTLGVNHNFALGEPVVLNDNGGTETVGVTEGTVYYAGIVTSKAFTLHTSEADAISDTARVNLTQSGPGNGEIQIFYSADAAIINNSGGVLNLEIVGGNAPSYRNVGSGTTTVTVLVTLTLSGMRDNTEVRVYLAGASTVVAGIEDATDGTADDRSFTFTAESGVSLDIRVFAVDYEPADLLSFTAVTATVPIQQRFDRNYSNPV